jgi:tetratricopeptide (TPR) repeat protein
MKAPQLLSFALALGLLASVGLALTARAEELPRLPDAERQALISRRRDETIEQLQRILPKIEEGSPEKPDLLYQLSELYLEKSRQLLQQEMSVYDAQYGRFQEAKKRGEKAEEPSADHRGSESYRAEVMALYERILRDYSAYARNDEVLFALGYNLYEVGRRREAIARYLELLQRFPRSRFAADTYLQLGNHHFDVANDLAKARDFYQKALKSDIPKVQSFALYKLAWCDYNAGDFQSALKKLQQVVDLAQTHGREMVDLKNEALGDTTALFVRLSRAEDAIQYYERLASPKQKSKLVARLAAQLADAGQFESAIQVYRYLISQSPNDPSAPEYQQAIVRCYEELRDRARVKSEMRRLVTIYGLNSSWWSANEGQAEVLRNAFNVSEEAMRAIAVDYHQEAQRTQQAETYRLARDIYAQYLSSFASSDDGQFVADQALNMRFYYAEVLWALEEWEAAAKQYEAVIQFKVPDRENAREVTDEKFRKTAAYNSVLAYEKLVKIDRGEPAKPDVRSSQKLSAAAKSGAEPTRIEKRIAKGLSEEPLTAHEQQLVAACDQYNRMFPEDSDEVELRYLAAMTYYRRKHFGEAAQRLQQIADQRPDDRRAQEAADLAMHILETREEWVPLNQMARRFLGDARLAKPGSEFAKRVAQVVEGSQYKWVDEVVYRQEKDPAKAAREFIRFADEFPRSENAPRALTYAAIAFGEARQLKEAILAAERVLRSYRRSPFELKARYLLTQDYEKLAEFAKAASMYEGLVAAYDRHASQVSPSKPPRAAGKAPNAKADVSGEADEGNDAQQLLQEAEKWIADAQFNAGLWWEALGRHRKAILAYRAYLSRFQDAKDAPEVKYTLGSLYQKTRQWAEAIKTYREFESEYSRDKRVSQARRYLAKYQQLVCARNLGNLHDSERLLQELRANYSRLPRDLRKQDDVQEAYASVRFWKLEPLWKEYAHLKLNNVATLKRDLNTKRRKLKELEKAYTDVLAIGAAEYGIGALTRIGLAYADLARNIVASPNPRGLTREQLELYRAELGKVGAPIEQHSVDIFEKAVAKASELSVYSEWILTAQESINALRPGTYGKSPQVSYRSIEAFASEPLQRVPTPSKVASTTDSGDPISSRPSATEER